jgi:uncharacterized protein YkwD
MRVRTAPIRKLAVVAALASVFVVPGPTAGAVNVLPADSLETAVVQKMNQVRRSHGLRALTVRPALRRAATGHTVNMARTGYFGHEWSNGAPFARWIGRYWPGRGYRSWSAGENLYWRAPRLTAAQVVNGWLASPPHRHNLLGRAWRDVGVGAVQIGDPIGVYAGLPTPTLVAAEFGRRG